MKYLVLVFVLCLSGQTMAQEVNPLKLKTARGKVISAAIHLPKTTTKLPAIVIAPGQGYHMDLPLNMDLAKLAAKNNIIALRFNWGYHPGRNPSPSYKNELQDIQTALNYLKAHELVDSENIMIVGKSFGSVIAHKIFQKDQDLKALFLNTPICTWFYDDAGNEVDPYPAMGKWYPKLKRESRPVHITLGSKDKLCETPMLYEYLKTAGRNFSVGVFGGGHSLNIGPWNDPAFSARNARNIKAALSSIVQWMNIYLDKKKR